MTKIGEYQCWVHKESAIKVEIANGDIDTEEREDQEIIENGDWNWIWKYSWVGW